MYAVGSSTTRYELAARPAVAGPPSREGLGSCRQPTACSNATWFYVFECPIQRALPVATAVA